MMRNSVKGLARAVVLAATTLAVSVNAFATGTSVAAPDTSAIDDAVTGIGVVGAATFTVFVLVKGYHWVRRAL